MDQKFSSILTTHRSSLLGRRFPIDIMYCTRLITWMPLCWPTASTHNNPCGHILIFLTGQAEIEAAELELKIGPTIGFKISELIICQSLTLPQKQAVIFNRSSQKLFSQQHRRDLTPIDDFVRDRYGFSKQKATIRTGMESLIVTLSRASTTAFGTAGRTGRNGRLYTAWSFGRTRTIRFPRFNERISHRSF